MNTPDPQPTGPYAPWLRVTWWTLSDAANIICGVVPPEPMKGEERLALASGGDRAILYFELKNLFFLFDQGESVPEGAYQAIGPNTRIRPTLALKVADRLGIVAPEPLAALLEKEREADANAEPPPLSLRKEATLNRIVGTLLAVIDGKFPETKRHSSFANPTELVDHIAKYDMPGMSARRLWSYVTDANAEYQESKPKA